MTELKQELMELLSPEAQAALKEHLHQQKPSGEVSEDFKMSQFWYTDEAAELIAKEAAREATKHFKQIFKELKASQEKPMIACVSCPSVFRAILKLKLSVECVLFEFDKRFEMYGKQFAFYDFNSPASVDKAFTHSFDYIIADPPYLNEECMSKTGETMALLCRTDQTPMLLNTGAILRELVFAELGLRECVWFPTHSKHIQNEFRSYCNYASDAFGGFSNSSAKQIPSPEQAQSQEVTVPKKPPKTIKPNRAAQVTKAKVQQRTSLEKLMFQ